MFLRPDAHTGHPGHKESTGKDLLDKVMEPRLGIVVFTGGAVLEDPCVEFIGRIHAHPELELLGVFCETPTVGLTGIARDLVPVVAGWRWD